MLDLPDLLSPLIGERPSWLFAVILVPHVLAGLVCVVTGAIAMRSRKRRGRHPRFGQLYYWSLGVVFVSATALAALRWSEDAYLFVLGSLAFGSATFGLIARRRRWPGWTTAHIGGMGVSYIVLLTAFYVDNGPRLPLWQLLPTLAFWVLPALLGLPIMVRAMRRYRLDSGTQVPGYGLPTMHEPRIPIACTLSPNETDQRLQEFEQLFANHLRELTRPTPRLLRLVFASAEEIEAATRDLFAREQECCAFFDFAVERQSADLIVEAAVPAGAEASLDELTAIARSAAPRAVA